MRDAKNALEGEQVPDWMLPINQMGSFASLCVQLGSGTGAQPFKTVKDYDNWLARAAQAARDLRHRHRQHARRHEGRRGAAEGADGQGGRRSWTRIIKDKPEDTLFWGPIRNMPADFSDADKTRLTAAFQQD